MKRDMSVKSCGKIDKSIGLGFCSTHNTSRENRRDISR